MQGWGFSDLQEGAYTISIQKTNASKTVRFSEAMFSLYN